MIHWTSSVATDLLAQWRWLVGGLPRVAAWSSAGDLFLRDEKGLIWRIDTGAGDMERVCDSAAALQALVDRPEEADELLLLPVVRSFEITHGPLGPEECLGFTTLPVFGGAYTAENRYRISIAEHASLTGDLHRQIRDLPDGTAARLKVVP